MRSLLLGLALVLALGPALEVCAASPESASKAEQIAMELKKSGQLKDYRVGVKYEDGVAWLSGTVTSAEQKQTAELLAQNCEGVSHVISKLMIEGGELVTPQQKTLVKKQVRKPQAKKDLRIQVASNRAEAAKQSQQLASRSQSASKKTSQLKMRNRRTPKSNMPVPYARTARKPQGRNVQAASYSQHANYCPDGSCMVGDGGGSMGGPAAMGPQGPAAVGQGVSYDNPQMPGYAWPSYAASPNYAALTYPKQYSASAWPYIGPFYPYPQVPLGWRKVTLEWDDGWWFLDFKDCKHCK